MADDIPALIALDLDEWDRNMERVTPVADWNGRVLLSLALEARTEIRRLHAMLDRTEAERDGLAEAYEHTERESERRACERDGVREELTRMAGDLEDVRATLAVRNRELRAVTGERDRLLAELALPAQVEALAAAGLPGIPYACPRCGGLRPLDGCQDGWHSGSLVGLPPEAPAGPLCAPQAAQEPPVGGIGPTETQRGAEGVACSGSHTIALPAGRLDVPLSTQWPLYCLDCGGAVKVQIFAPLHEATYVVGAATLGTVVPASPAEVEAATRTEPLRLEEIAALADALPESYGAQAADVDTVNGASQRREGER